MKLMLIVASLMLSGCVSMTGVEHTVYGGISRNHPGGEIYSAQPSGHEEEGGAWYVGSSIKTIWKVK